MPTLEQIPDNQPSVEELILRPYATEEEIKEQQAANHVANLLAKIRNENIGTHYH